MATSRTGTTEWILVRDGAKRRDKRNGVTHCQWCGVNLDYDTTRNPNSAEPDHIIPWQRGGTNTLDNLICICRRCNQSKGHRDTPKRRIPKQAASIKPLKVSRQR